MAIAVGKYIIRSALNEELVLMVSGGSKSKGARVTTGALTEDDNRCYWHSAIVGNYNTFMNVNTGANGYAMVDQVVSGRNVTQDAGYNKKNVIDRCEWLAVLSGNTMVVNGADVATYYLKLFKDQNLYLTVPDNGGDAFISPLITGTPSTVTVTVNSEELSIEIDRLAFQEAVENISGTYAFIFDGTNWLLDATPVSLDTYGITVTGTPVSGNTITVVFKEYIETGTDRQEFYFEASTYVNRSLATPNTLRQSGDKTFVVCQRESLAKVAGFTGNVKNPAVNKTTFETQITTTGRHVFTYNSSQWRYNNTVVNLANYGITYTGSPKNNDTITIDYTGAYQSIIWPIWKCSSNAIIYEYRYRYRYYDTDGFIIDDWYPWVGWNRYQATAQLNNKKKYNGTMSGNGPIITPIVNNTEYTKADVQIEVRLTSAKNWGAYNTNDIQHGAAVSQIITVHCIPTIAFQTGIYSPDGLALTYQTDYKLSGSTVTLHSVKSGTTTLVEEYVAETSINDEYYGDLYLTCDEMYSLPRAGEVLTVNATFAEENVAASATVTNTVTVEFDSSWGLDLDPTYEITDRYTVMVGIKKYVTTQLFMEKPQLDGTSLWVECDKIYEGLDLSGEEEIVIFEYAPPFGASPNLMWVAIDEDSQWTNAITNPSGLVINSNFYTWFWIDDYNIPHTAILKYNIDKVMQPDDDITLGANKFITTGREYPVFRYTKSLERSLDIDGIVLKDENDPYCTLADFESMAIANHCVYRRPDGKWFQVAIQGIKFVKEELYTKVTIEQEAETR